MASAQSTAAPSVAIPDLIDQILNTKEDAPDFDLQQLVETIDNILASYNNAALGKSTTAREKLTSMVDSLPSASDAAVFSEGVANNVKRIATQISEYSGDNHSTAIAVLNAVGNVHWLGLSFLLVATVLQRFDTIHNNKEECLELLKSMNHLAKVILRLKGFPRTKVNMHNQIKESIGLIVNGAILCCSQVKSKIFQRFRKANKHQKDLKQLRSQVEQMYKQMVLDIETQILSILENSNKPDIPCVNHAVGIEQQVEDVVNLLQWEEDKPAVAVVVHGIGGSGKTTLADAVYASLKDKLQGWAHSKVTLIENLETHPDIRQLQSLILQHLTGVKQDVTDLQSGRQRLKDIMEKESIFLYIDNVLFIERLRELLPMLVTSPKKLRLLLTARKTDVSEVMEDCGIKPCEIYATESLSIEAAIEVLCRKIDREREVSSILEKRPQVKELAEICRCCPLFLEVVGGYLRKRKNDVEAYERVFGWLQHGEPFSGEKEYSFDENRVLFAYNELETNSQEAFLDICSFFYHWEWEKVAFIVGKEEMECLEEGALIKRKEDANFQGKKVSNINIHDLLLQVGRNKSKDNRLRTADEFSMALQNKKPLSQIKGIWLQSKWNEDPFHKLSAEDLDTMSGSLRIFAMGDSTVVKGKCTKHFNKLRFLQVGRVPKIPIDVSKLTSLSYMEYGSKDNMIFSQCKSLSNLKVVKFSNYFDRCDTVGFPEIGNPLKLSQLALSYLNFTKIPCLAKFYNLEKLELYGCHMLEELPDVVGELQSLRELNIIDCRKLKQLPSGFGQLSGLITLMLECCCSLQELPNNFEKLSSLEYLNLNGCSGLLHLPERLGYLPSLTCLNLDGCKKLISFPKSLGGLTSLRTFNMSFWGCSSLKELPEEVSWLAKCKRITFFGCNSLKMIPNQFGKLTCLEDLDLSGCASLEELCSDFQCLAKLKVLTMSGCTNLSCLPEGFGKLRSLERLNLSGSDKLEELCSDFNCLGGLKELELRLCYSLSKLPDCFGQLGCLEKIDLSDCSNLEKLSDDFSSLASLISLNLSNCKKLGGEWMDSVGKIPSLLCVDIGGSELMIQRWMEMQREKENWHFVVRTNCSYESRARWILEAVISNVLDKEGLLIDTHKLPFYSSSLQPYTPLILIIDGRGYPANWELFAKNLQWLEAISNLSFSIIYVGRHLDALPSVLGDRIVASIDQNSLFLLKLLTAFYRDDLGQNCGISVFRSSGDGLGEDGLKCLSAWQDISYITEDEATFISKTPRESNIDLLRALLVTPETDFLLLHNSQQVKVDDLQGKLVLLLKVVVLNHDEYISALKDVYLKMRESAEYERVEVVWIPNEGTTWEEFERCARSAPWPVVPNPWLPKHSCLTKVSPRALVVDEKGRISSEDALPMIRRWGVDAYPFSASREEELKKAEWNELNSLQFLFHKFPLFQMKAKEAMECGKIILLCGGSIDEMLEFITDVNYVLTMLESVIQMFYVGCTYDGNEESEYEMKRMDMYNIPSLSFSHVRMLWYRLYNLKDESDCMGDENIVQLKRSLVLGLFEAQVESRKVTEGKDKRIPIVVVDENGEMISGLEKQVVQILCQKDKVVLEILLKDIKNEGFGNILEKISREC